MKEPIVRMEHISKSFPGVKALQDVSFELKRGSIHGLVGENGAGKSTLMKILSGAYASYQGDVFFNGNKVQFKNEHDALEAGISIVPQELNYVPQLTIEDNILLGRKVGVTKLGWLEEKKRHDMTKKLIEDLGLAFNPKTKMSELNVAQCQMVEIIKAISRNSQVVIMDEPTSALTDVETKQLMNRLRDLKEKGVAIVYISHKLDEVFSICDQITVMRDSKWIGSVAIEDAEENEIIEMMVGRKVNELYPEKASCGKEELLRVEHLSREGVFQDVSFCLKRGEILGISGMMGAGRSEIVRAIFGLDPHSEGAVYLEGMEIKIKSPVDAIKAGIAMVPENRAEDGFVGGMSVKHNVILPSGDIYAKKFFLENSKINQDVEEIRKKLSIKVPSTEEHVVNLSGGNQQKVVLAKWLIRDVKVLILDEPTRGIDIGAKQEIYRLMNEYAAAGMGIVFISSEMQEVIGVSHRILVVDGGSVIGEFAHGDVSQNAIMELIVKKGRKKG